VPRGNTLAWFVSRVYLGGWGGALGWGVINMWGQKGVLVGRYGVDHRTENMVAAHMCGFLRVCVTDLPAGCQQFGLCWYSPFTGG
jgi:hypothetical protein